jgi:hypothetical protein
MGPRMRGKDALNCAVILALALLGVLPRTEKLGYYPAGGLGSVLLLVIALLLIGRIWLPLRSARFFQVGVLIR